MFGLVPPLVAVLERWMQKRLSQARGMKVKGRKVEKFLCITFAAAAAANNSNQATVSPDDHCQGISSENLTWAVLWRHC